MERLPGSNEPVLKQLFTCVNEKSLGGGNVLTSNGHLEWASAVEVVIVNGVKAGAEMEK